jgi:hypothetical protein
VRTPAFATAAAGFFTGTAPYEKHHGDQYHDQWKKLLPIHAANITVKTKRATGFFKIASGLQLSSLRPKTAGEAGAGNRTGFSALKFLPAPLRCAHG